MSPAAGGAAPAQSAATAVFSPPIAGQEPDRAAARRDPPGQPEAADPANAAAKKSAWGVPAPTPAAAATAMAIPGAGIIGDDASWPALVESMRSKSASSDSLKSLSDGSGPSSAHEDSIAASVSPHPVVEAKPISTSSNPAPTLPPNAAAPASSQQNGSTTQPNLVRRSGSNGGNNVGSCSNGSSGSCRAANSSAGGGSSGNIGDGYRNTESLGSGSSCNSSNRNGGSNLSYNVPGSGTSLNSNDSSRNSFGNNNWNNNTRGVGRSSNGGGDGNNRNSGGSSNHWNNNSRYSNGGGGRGGFQGRRDHERGGNFSPRNYPRVPVMTYHHHQQQPGFYQPGPFHRPPSPSPSHFMVPQQFVPYFPTFGYNGDLQPYPLYFPPVEQFQNMHLVRPPMQPSYVPQDQSNLQEDIRKQIEYYFSTNNLCHDTYLRSKMNDQGWVPIDLIVRFNKMKRFTDKVDTNYILDAIRGSKSLEVQENNVRRRNDWAGWLLHIKAAH